MIFQHKSGINPAKPFKNAFFVLDQQENIVFISHQFIHLPTAYSCIGKKIWSEFPTLRKTQMYEKFRESIQFHQKKTFECFDNKQQLWYNFHMVPTDTGSEIFITDITALKAEASLRKLQKSEARFHQMVMETPALICLLKGADHTLELINPYGLQYFGLQDYTGLSVKKAAKSTQSQAFVQLLDQVYQKEQPLQVEEFQATFDFVNPELKEYPYFNFALQPMRDEQGRVEGILLFGYEVTDQVLAKKLLNDGSDRFRILLEAYPQIAWTAQPDGQLDYFNQRWYDYTGLTYDETRGEGWLQMIHPNDLKKMVEQWHHSLATGNRFETESRFRKASDGQYHWHLCQAIPVSDKAGKINLWVGSCTDINEQKKAIVHLHYTQQQLHRINAELHEKNLELEKTNRDLDNFVYTASHDLKAPVSNIEGLSNLLLDYVQDEKIRNRKIFTALSMIDFSIQRFKTTIQDLTDIAKLNKNFSDDVALTNINEIIEEVTIMMREMIHKSGAKIMVRTDACHIISFSYSNFKSLIYNLLSNAVKYRHPEREPEIIIETSYNQSTFLLCVKDNGIGVAPQHHDKIFTMFKRLHNHIEGNGVGLFLVKRIVENAGGKVALESQLGKGAIFKVYLPNIMI